MKVTTRALAVLSLVVSAGAVSIVAAATDAEDHAADEIRKYRQMLEDGNPAELMEMKGEALWREARGPKGPGLEQRSSGNQLVHF